MRRQLTYLAITVVIVIGLASLGTAQAPWRIFGTSTTGAGVPITATSAGLLNVNIQGGVFPNGATLRTGTTAGDTLSLQAYDVDGAAYVSMMVLTANNIPTVTFPGDMFVVANAYLYEPVYIGRNDTYDRLIVSPVAKGATWFDGTITSADLTAARTWTLPNASGTVSVMSLTAHTAAGATETVDFSLGPAHRVILDENLTITLTNPIDGGRYAIEFVQDAGATNTVTWADEANIYWGDGGTAPVITATANAISLCTLIYDGTLSKYLGACSLDHK